MKKLVIIPDSFKGTLSSARVCELVGDCARRVFPGCEVRAIPVADGGEGSVDAFLASVGGERVTLAVTGPWFERCEGFYGLLYGGTTAVVEMAAAAGLPMVGERRDPSATTTYGVGELMLDAARRGARRIILGLGGSLWYNGGANQYTERQMRRRIRRAGWAVRRAGGVDIVLTHAPPRGYGDAEDAAHRGFECFEDFLNKYEPKYLVHGHVHMNYGRNIPRVVQHGATQIVNAWERFVLDV